MKKRQIIGLLLFVLGIFLIINSASITGFAIIKQVNFEIPKILGLVFIISGIFMMLAREKVKIPLEKIVLISKQAQERSEKDPRVRENMQRYAKEIEMIKADPEHRQQEMIGSFHVSPRSGTGSGIRVAWHRTTDTENNREIIYIDDFLYHINDKDYVGRWNKKAGSGKIKISDYEFK